MRGDVVINLKHLEKKVHESADKLAEVFVKEQASEKNLLPEAARKEKIQHELEDNAKEISAKMQEGLQACITALDSCGDLPKRKNEVIEELKHCFSSIDSDAAFTQLGQAIFDDISWKTQLNISTECMTSLYKGAKFLFENKSFHDAENAFFVLCALDPTIYVHWVGYGHACFHVQNYEKSINGYSMASALEPNDSWPHIWAANAFEKINDREHAKMALGVALELEKEKQTPDADIIGSIENRLHVYMNT